MLVCVNNYACVCVSLQTGFCLCVVRVRFYQYKVSTFGILFVFVRFYLCLWDFVDRVLRVCVRFCLCMCAIMSVWVNLVVGFWLSMRDCVCVCTILVVRTRLVVCAQYCKQDFAGVLRVRDLDCTKFLHLRFCLWERDFTCVCVGFNRLDLAFVWVILLCVDDFANMILLACYEHTILFIWWWAVVIISKVIFLRRLHIRRRR